MLHTSTRRIGAAVAATALSAGALVAVSAPAAQAATVAATFTCNFPSLGAKDIPVGITATLPSAANAGLDAPAIPVLLSVTLPADVVSAAKGLFQATSIGGFSNDMVATLDDLSSSDSADLALQDVRFPQTNVPILPNQPLTLNTPNPLATPGVVPATTVPVNLPGKGTYDIAVPSAFKFTATKQGDVVMLADVPCALKAGSPASLGSIVLAANESTDEGQARQEGHQPARRPSSRSTSTPTTRSRPARSWMIGRRGSARASLDAKGKVTVTLKEEAAQGQERRQGPLRGDDYTNVSRDKEGRDQGQVTLFS